MKTDPKFIRSSPNWGELNHAYGAADDVPVLLSQLTSEEIEQRKDAVNELLYSRAYHQGDVYSCTPWVMRYVIPLLSNPLSDELKIHGDTSLSDEIVHFCQACGSAQPSSDELAYDIKAALAEGTPLFLERTKSKDITVAKDALWILTKVRGGGSNNEG